MYALSKPCAQQVFGSLKNQTILPPCSITKLLPLDECIVNTPQSNQKRTKREAKTEKNKEDEELEQVTKARKNQEQVT